MNTLRIAAGLFLLAHLTLALPVFDDPFLGGDDSSSSSSSEEDGFWGFGLIRNLYDLFNFDNAKVINSTSKSEVIDGHIYTHNHTVYENDQNAIISVDKILILPLDSSNSTEDGLKDREEVTTEVGKPPKKSENTNEIPQIDYVEPSVVHLIKERVRRGSYFTNHPAWLAKLRQKYFPVISAVFPEFHSTHSRSNKFQAMIDNNRMPPPLGVVNSNTIESRESLEEVQHSNFPSSIEDLEDDHHGMVSQGFEEYDRRNQEWENRKTDEIPIDLSRDTRVNDLMEAQPLRKPDPDVEIFSNNVVNVPYQPERYSVRPTYTSARYNYPRYNFRNHYEHNK